MRKRKSKYARVNPESGIIQLLHNNMPSSNGLDVIIEDCEIIFDERNNCIISGQKWEWGFVYDKTFTSKLKYDVIDSHTKLGYETLYDRIKGVKTPYVIGWHRKKITTIFNAIVSKFFIIE